MTFEIGIVCQNHRKDQKPFGLLRIQADTRQDAIRRYLDFGYKPNDMETLYVMQLDKK